MKKTNAEFGGLRLFAEENGGLRVVPSGWQRFILEADCAAALFVAAGVARREGAGEVNIKAIHRRRRSKALLFSTLEIMQLPINAYSLVSSIYSS